MIKYERYWWIKLTLSKSCFRNLIKWQNLTFTKNKFIQAVCLFTFGSPCSLRWPGTQYEDQSVLKLNTQICLQTHQVLGLKACAEIPSFNVKFLQNKKAGLKSGVLTHHRTATLTLKKTLKLRLPCFLKKKKAVSN